MVFLRRLQYLLPWRRRAAEREMRDELHAIAHMADPRELGNLSLVAEDARVEWGWTRLESLLRDLRYGWRGLRRNPGFGVTAVLSLAIGIGANTALFSLWHRVLFAALPAITRPGELVILTNPGDSGSWTGRWTGRTDGPRSWITYAEFLDLRDHAGVFTCLMTSQSSLTEWRVRVDGGEEEDAFGRLVSGEFFDVLGAGAAIGRVFSAAEDRADAHVAVISYRYWQRRFGGRLDALGHTLTIRNTAITIVGVAAPWFIGETSGQQPDLWMPIGLQPAVLPGRDRLRDTAPEKVMWLHAFGRLKPGVTLAQADAQANAILQRNLESFYGDDAVGPRRAEFLDQRLRLRAAPTGASSMRGDVSASLTALLAGVGTLLLIACANLANLLLARGAARKAEIALRMSLGASRWRVIRQLLAESLVIGVLAGLAAVVVANTMFRALVRMIAASDPRFAMDFSLDTVILLFIVALTFLTTSLFAVLPAWQSTKNDAATGLRDQTRATTGSRQQLRSGRSLVGVQLALSLPLLCGAGLLARTFVNLQHADLGFPTARLLLVRIDIREAAADEDRATRLRHDVFEELRRLPGVESVSYSHLGLFSGGNSTDTVVVEGASLDDERVAESDTDVVGPRYFSTVGVPIRAGREILDNDRAGAPRVCVINDAFARKFVAGRNPLGLHVMTVGDDRTRLSCEIVGIAHDTRTQSLRGEVGPRYFVAADQPPASDLSPTFLLRTTGEPGAVATAARAAVRRVAAALPVMSAQTLEEQIAPVVAQDRVTAQLAVAFGGMALALAAVGLYGVLSYGVARRRSEIAIRIALGAAPRGVIAMILRETSRVLVLGVIAGAGLTYVVSRLLTSRLYGVSPQDPLTIVAATVLLLLVALGAALLPARRASKVDPAIALRS